MRQRSWMDHGGVEWVLYDWEPFVQWSFVLHWLKYLTVVSSESLVDVFSCSVGISDTNAAPQQRGSKQQKSRWHLKPQTGRRSATFCCTHWRISPFFPNLSSRYQNIFHNSSFPIHDVCGPGNCPSSWKANLQLLGLVNIQEEMIPAVPLHKVIY